MQNQSLRPVKIFYCYAPEDRALQEELSRHLSPLRRLRNVTTWVDSDIQPGAEWQREQDAHLETADLLLLLLSADFMASDYCYTVGMKRALERHRAGTAHVIPILLRPVEWEKTPLGRLSALPTGNKPVTQWADRDAAWLDIVQGIHELVRTFLPKHLLSPQAIKVLYPEPSMPSRDRTGQQPAGRMLHQRYRLLHPVGQGGMGAVYAAQDTQLGDRLVAVKEMSTSRLSPEDLPRAVEQFRQEAHLLASLHHPNLPVIHEYFREDDRWYLVMSFVEGQNLQAALNTAPGNRLPVSEVVRIGIELCEVLEYLHTHDPQVIFRDLKPLNIMLMPKGHICLIDFGIARHFKQEQTRDTAYYYSVGYAPPEQYGQSQTGPQSDIYSLGATLHQMLTGHNPASTPFQFPNVHLVDPTIPVPFAKLLTQMLEMNEHARPAGVAEIKERLEKILDSTSIPEAVAVKPGRAKNKEKDESENAISRQKAAQTGDQAAGFWSRIDTFFKQRRQVVWMCFIVTSLAIGGLLPFLDWFAWFGTPIYPLLDACCFISDTGISGSYIGGGDFPYITVIGAMGAAGIGFVLYRLKRRQPPFEILGGIALIGTAFVNIALSVFFDGPTYYPVNGYFFYYYVLPSQPGFYFNIFLFLTLFALWLFVGARFFLRSANWAGSSFLGILLMIGGISLLWPEPQRHFTLSVLTLLPTFICEVCGAVTLVIALVKGIHNKRGTSSKRIEVVS